MIIYPVSNTDQKRRGLTYKVFVEQLIAVLLILTVFAGHTYSRGVYCTACRGVYIADWGGHWASQLHLYKRIDIYNILQNINLSVLTTCGDL